MCETTISDVVEQMSRGYTHARTHTHMHTLMFTSTHQVGQVEGKGSAEEHRSSPPHRLLADKRTATTTRGVAAADKRNRTTAPDGAVAGDTGPSAAAVIFATRTAALPVTADGLRCAALGNGGAKIVRSPGCEQLSIRSDTRERRGTHDYSMQRQDEIDHFPIAL